MSDIKKKFLFQLLFAFSQLLFPLFSYPYLTRTIGAIGLGKIAFIEYSTGLIITVVSFGIPFYGVREVAKAKNDSQKRYTLFSELLFLHLAVSVLGIATFLCFIYFNASEMIAPGLIILGCFNILIPVFVADWYMQGTEAFKFTTLRNIALRIAGILAMFILVKNQTHFVRYFLIVIIIQALVAASNLYVLNISRIKLPSFVSIRQHIKPLWHFFLSASSISVYVFFDVIILGKMADDQSVGYYATAIKIIKLSLMLVLSLNVVLFPRIAFLNSSSDIRRINELIQKSLNYIVVTTVPIGFFFYFLAHELIHIIAGKSFGPSILLVQFLCILPLIIGFSNLFVYQVLVPFSKEKKLLLSVFIACVCSLALNIILAFYFKEKGTALATILTELLVTLLSGIFAFKTIRFSLPVIPFFQSILACLPFVVIVVLSRMYLNNDLLVLSISFLFGFTLYSLLQMFLFKNIIYTQVWKEMKQRIADLY